MALGRLQERVERSIFEKIRKVLVDEGYIPNITNTGLFGSEPYSIANDTAWETALKTIANSAKKFAIEVFDNSQTKGQRKTPRISIIPRRIEAGEIGSAPQPFIAYNPNVIDETSSQLVKMTLPLEASTLFLDIHLTSSSGSQERILNAVLNKAIGPKRFIPWYDQPGELFFAKQYSYYDLPDPPEGESEKVYSYEIPDLYDVPEEYAPVALTTEITLEVIGLPPGSILTQEGIIGISVPDGGLHIDLSGITFT